MIGRRSAKKLSAITDAPKSGEPPAAILGSEELAVERPEVALRDRILAAVELVLLPVVVAEVEDDLGEVASNDQLPIASPDHAAVLEEIAERDIRR